MKEEELMNRQKNMIILAGLALAMTANFAAGQGTGDIEGDLPEIPVSEGPEQPRVMRCEVTDLSSGAVLEKGAVVSGGATLRIICQLQESAGYLPLDWTLFARISGQDDVKLSFGEGTAPLIETPAFIYTVPNVMQPTEITFVIELLNKNQDREAEGVNNTFTIMASPAQRPADPTVRRPAQRPNDTLPAGQPQPAAPAVEQPIEPAPAGHAISNVRVRLDPVVGGRMPVLTWSATGDNLTMTVTDDTGAVLATGPTGRIELPVTEPTNQEQRREISLEVSDGNGGAWSMTTELVIRPESRQQRLDVDPRRRDHDVYAEVPEAARRIRHEEEFGVTDTNTLMRLYLENADGSLSERVVMTPRYRLTDLGEGRYQLPGYPRRIGRLSRD